MSYSIYSQRLAQGKQLGAGSAEYKQGLNTWWAARKQHNAAARATPVSAAATTMPNSITLEAKPRRPVGAAPVVT